MRAILGSACGSVGLDAARATLLRGHSNAVLRLANAAVVVKIARQGSDAAGARTAVLLTRWLTDQGFPTVSLYPGIDQPILVDGHAVTFWAYLPQPAEPVTARQLGSPLRLLHGLGLPPFPLPKLDAIAAIRCSLAASSELSVADARFLTDRANTLEQQLAGVRYELPRAALHGDPQHRNALHTSDGQVVLCDWDSAVLGPPEWDLVTVEIHCRRFGYPPGHARAFADAYGHDITTWPGYPVLRDVRELRITTTNARKSTDQPAKLAQVHTRIAALRAGDTHHRWEIL